ncbi:hypothetical protein BCV72DRAFT_227743 [Rhizopus microsporus var. microsporus]|uniref:Uncharacterized protein n=2 Tax=Rhizopus microsporus TaxID=58291 RepID=A0A2G4SPC0_RHIZD|nr:uncharacterized protein RHIMIDRAFT_293414 [Rhizopus microsporus ATCC 52813]ORE06775.1 hypothetical protein BCV72DRAFT_227743 [Rhizopus microsporus var. microsporus]PHZ10614.1 hypothetical protein RHIMIDRAFT_293414 [Rhizopus microsporus ATCC 52813]
MSEISSSIRIYTSNNALINRRVDMFDQQDDTHLYSAHWFFKNSKLTELQDHEIWGALNKRSLQELNHSRQSSLDDPFGRSILNIRKRHATVACDDQYHAYNNSNNNNNEVHNDHFYWNQLLSSTCETQFWHHLASFIKYCMKSEYHQPQYFKSVLSCIGHRLRLSGSDLHVVAYQCQNLDMQGMLIKDYTIRAMRITTQYHDPIATIQSCGYPVSMEQNLIWLSEAGVTDQVRKIFAHYFPKCS